MDFDVVITNGTIVDGTGRSRFRADLVLLDAATVADHATLEQLDAPPVGIRAALAGACASPPGLTEKEKGS